MTKEEIKILIEVLAYSLTELKDKLTYEQGIVIEKTIKVLSEKY